jgi:hypothetical protein
MTNRFCGLPEKARSPSEPGAFATAYPRPRKVRRAYDATQSDSNVFHSA